MDIGICGVKETDVDDIDEESVDLEPSVGLITGTVDGKVVLKTDELEVICDGKEDELPDNERVDLAYLNKRIPKRDVFHRVLRATTIFIGIVVGKIPVAYNDHPWCKGGKYPPSQSFQEEEWAGLHHVLNPSFSKRFKIACQDFGHIIKGAM